MPNVRQSGWKANRDFGPSVRGRARISWRRVLAGAGTCALGCGLALGRPDSVDRAAERFGRYFDDPIPASEGDIDADGIADSEEDDLARTYAPVVVLHGRDWTKPASVSWLLARADFRGRTPAVRVAGALPASTSMLNQRLPRSVRAGSRSPEDWTTYVHVYLRTDGGINLQYWFFYPYNDGLAIFDHESDWEHVTVRLDRSRNPVGVYYAEHENNRPGHYREWSSIRKEGFHPIVLSADGTHASYPDRAAATWFDRVSHCADAARCSDPIWRTWEGGGLQNLGERSAPRVLDDIWSYDARWGEGGWLPGTRAPFGAMHHPGFCHLAFERCRGAVDGVGSVALRASAQP
jgi:hypothetical protein